MRPSPALDGLPAGRKALAYGAVAVADAIARLALRGRAAGDRGLVVSVANLGDQLRFMNVWSRFAPPDVTFDVACNASTKEAFELYDCIGDVVEYGQQGAASLGRSAAAIFAKKKPYAWACVPHPFFSRPIAMAYARTHAERVCAVQGRGGKGDIEVPLDRSSWRGVYEAVARACLPTGAVRSAPGIRAGVRHVTKTGNRRIVVHPGSRAPSKTLPSSQLHGVVVDLSRRGYDVVVIGSRAEEEDLRAMLGDVDVTFVFGAPLKDVCAMLAASAVFVGVDSSMMNLADAVGIPSVIVYTTTDPRVSGPFYARSTAIRPSRPYGAVGVEAEASWNRDGDAALTVDAAEIVAAVTAMAP